jgi:2,3-bisphosphoglycerate-dependent phosphoglycerate mutase
MARHPTLDAALLASANIHPSTGLATDFLNHFNEPAMLLQMLADMPDMAEDVLAWTPISYAEHFIRSNFSERDLAIRAYDEAAAPVRAAFDRRLPSGGRAFGRHRPATFSATALLDRRTWPPLCRPQAAVRAHRPQADGVIHGRGRRRNRGPGRYRRACLREPGCGRRRPRALPTPQIIRSHMGKPARCVIVALLRHGQSQWNLENRFTGWVDVDLTAEGEAQARAGGRLLGRLRRRVRPALYLGADARHPHRDAMAIEEAGLAWLPVVKDWRLNERHYGALTGLDKAETAAKHGEAQVKIWRRSFDVAPPELAPGSDYDFSADRRYAGIADLPRTESLKTTLDRVLPYWNAAIAPDLRDGRNLIVAAHGNSLRAIVMHLFGLTPDEIMEIEMPTGNPLLIELDATLKPRAARYLDADRAQKLPPV